LGAQEGFRDVVLLGQAEFLAKLGIQLVGTVGLVLDGINDGFLTPFKVKQIQTTLDTYYYTPDDTVVEGQVEAGKLY